ncbi:hypothetical protein BC835DRAFT_251979 [Cytidiella melzeri]|nr:hypothetical protein BC835DRAFT_251979 [Cytidiella melzeri]
MTAGKAELQDEERTVTVVNGHCKLLWCLVWQRLGGAAHRNRSACGMILQIVSVTFLEYRPSTVNDPVYCSHFYAMSVHRTPWAHKSSSLPSDRIVGHASKPPKQAAKGKQKEVAVPRSKAVRQLENLRDGLASLGEGIPVRDAKGGCYCQAREHELSTYTPICTTCGLILCSLNLPHHACPHCLATLLTSSARLSLLQTLEQRIAEKLAQEEREREQAIEEARQAAGAFPTLAAAASGTSSILDSHPTNQPHKVLSLNAKTKKVTVASYTQRVPSPLPSKGASKEHKEPEPTRTPRPPSEVSFSHKSQNFERPWINLRPGNKPAYYIPRAVQQIAEASGPSNNSRRKKGKGRGGPAQAGNENAESGG